MGAAEGDDRALAEDGWIYAGILWGALATIYSLANFYPDSSRLLYWGGAVAATICLPFWLLPWQQWGWPSRPWHRSAMALPGLTVAVTLTAIGWQSSLLVGAYYAWIAQRLRRLRLSYVALLLADFGLLQLLDTVGWLNTFWVTLLLGGSGLYAIGVDPGLADASQKETRHGLRCLLVALICITAILEFETAVGSTWAGVAVGLAVAIAGLLLRVRAYLYVGTAAFAIALLRQSAIAISGSTVALWSIGIVLGLTLIWIAATFEARRETTLNTLQNWSEALQDWE